MTRKELKQEAKDQLRGNWGWAILLSFVSGLLAYIVNDISYFTTNGKDAIAGYVDSLQENAVHTTIYTVTNHPNPLTGLITAIVSLLIGVLFWGVTYTVLRFRDKGEKANIFKGMFSGYTGGRFDSTFVTYLLYEVFLLLWALLLLIPAFIKSYSYAMTPYILKDMIDAGHKPTATEAITESRQLMDGHKAELFVLDLSFLGWWLLSVITFGIGFLWVTPYYRQTKANFYRHLAGNQYQK